LYFISQAIKEVDTILNINLLKNYKAKLNGQSIYSHNQDLIHILKQLHISKEMYNQLIKIINYHDIGKVVDSFQNNITNTHRKVRHEMLSASVKRLTDIERIAILTHHKSLTEIQERFFIYYDEYLKELEEMSNKLNIEVEDISEIVLKYTRNKDLLHNRTAVKLKGLLNYCDHLGSAGLKKLYTGIDTKDRYNFNNLTTLQQQTKCEDEDVVIISATGSGKTEASLFWANNIDKYKNKRLFYILPFTTSINAMYKRLNKDGFKVSMLHNKAEYFLYKELDGDYITSKKQYQLYKYFTNQITVSTIYQIFKAMFNCRFNEMMLSMYQDSIFIIDEIHCYDEKQLALILTTLKYLKDNYNIKICIMSASMPTKLSNLIQAELNIHKKLTLTKEENDKIKKHKIIYKDMYLQDDISLMINNYNNGNKIIVVANTVKKAQKMYQILKDNINNSDDIILIHGKFNQRDRERIEKQIKDKKVLVGTQAIEVSLNIDFDAMFTEISPIDSQIQRWGRINRKKIEELKEIKNIYVYNSDDNIYDKDLIRKTKEVLQKIDIVNENKIQEYLDYTYDKDFTEYYKYKNICEEIFKDIQIAKWDNNYNEIISFAGASVLPEKFIDEYQKYIENKQYYEANSLFVNISEGEYKYTLMNNAIDKDNSYIYYDYDENVGLQFGEYGNFF